MKHILYKLNALLCFIILLSSNLFAQIPSIQWQKCYGGLGYDGANCICQTKDGGYLMGGYSTSTTGEVTGNHGSTDCWVLKTDISGNILWEKSYGGSNDEAIWGVLEDINGGYFLAGQSRSNDGDVSVNHGSSDGWLIKTDDTGHIIWQYVLGSTGYDYFGSVINTPDSGYLVTGIAGANDGDVSGLTGLSGFWVIKITKTGVISWKKVYGGSGYDLGDYCINTNDNGFLIIGTTQGGGVVSGFHGATDAWVIKLNDTGGLVWNKAYGGSAYDNAISVFQKSNNDYVIGGYSNSNNGQVSGNHGFYDYWVYSINDTGKLLWEHSYGGSGIDFFSGMHQTYDSGIIIAGQAEYLNGDVTCAGHTSTGGDDYWIIKTNDTGKILWENCFGGSADDTANGIVQTADSGYAICGSTVSNNFDVSGNHGAADFWLLKLRKDPPLKVSQIKADPRINVYPTLTNGLVYIDVPVDDKVAVFLTDMSGKKIDVDVLKTNNKTAIKINNLTDGVYILNVVYQGAVSSYKLVYKP